MPKNIVICSDGTGNTAVKGRGTNVFKLFEAVDVVGHLTDSTKREHVAIYDDGVGTQKLKLLRALAGAFGFGLARNVRQLYEELVRCYTPDDEIYMFGFSRGAFTVRTLAGLVDRKGILDPSGRSAGELDAMVGDLYRDYRKSSPALLERLMNPVTDGVRRTYRWLGRVLTRSATPQEPKFRDKRTIHFVGVWDTVDAVGFPIPWIAEAWNVVIHRFKFTSRDLPESVKKACHALAIDEERTSFAPFLWNHAEGKTEQVWFAGVHSNVGGGYPKQGMSLVALDWMMSHAELASGGTLRFGKGLRIQLREASNVNDSLYDSRSGLAIYYRYRPRNVHDLCDEVGAPVRVHYSVIDRLEKRTRGYAPGNLPISFEIVGTPGEEGSIADRLGPARLERTRTGNSASAWPGSTKVWVAWRQLVQVLFVAFQIALVFVSFRSSPVEPSQLPGSSAGDVWTVENGMAWMLEVVENAVAPVPGTFVQDRIVKPMFAYPWIFVTFVLLFPLAYFLGLFGRMRIEAISSNRWRQARIVT